MWLAPFAPGEAARVTVLLDAPTPLSMLRVWNYARTPARGAAELHVAVDGAIVYGGYLAPAPPEPGAECAEAGTSGMWGQAILFAGGARARAERARVHAAAGAQHCVVIDERSVLEGAALVRGEGAAATAAAAAAAASASLGGGTLRPGTSVQSFQGPRGVAGAI